MNVPIIRIPRDARILRELLFDFIPDLTHSLPNKIDYRPTTVRVGDLSNGEYRLSVVVLEWDRAITVEATLAAHPRSSAYPGGKRELKELKITKGKKVQYFAGKAVAHLPPW